MVDEVTEVLLSVEFNTVSATAKTRHIMRGCAMMLELDNLKKGRERRCRWK